MGSGPLKELLRRADAGFEGLSARRTRHVLGRRDLHPMPTIGYARRGRARILGRVVQVPPMAWERDGGAWRNALALLHRIFALSAPGVEVEVRVGECEARGTTDEVGRFDLMIEHDRPAPEDGFLRAVVSVPGEGARVEVEALAVRPGPASELGVLSDIDDTILASDVASQAKMWWKALTHGPYRRKSFPGAAELYRRLREGASGAACNPFFYVSGSSWDLYDLLVEFLQHQGFPLGHLRLKDVRRGFGPESRGFQRRYKEGHLRAILDFYPDLPFLLIGDAGEADPEIYTDLVRERGSRIRAVYIRTHAEGGDDPARLEELAEECADHGVDLVAASTTSGMATHAVEHALLR